MMQNILYTEGLGLEQNYFNSIYTKPHMQLRYLYYSKYNHNETEELINNGKYRVNPHEDWLEMTLFHAGRSRGLQKNIVGKDCV